MNENSWAQLYYKKKNAEKELYIKNEKERKCWLDKLLKTSKPQL